MAWTFAQDSGWLVAADGAKLAQGYAGHGDGKGNPAMQDVHNTGPLPCGGYEIGPPVEGTHLGPFALPLTPDPANEMFGRTAFFIHGDSIAAPGTASDGCVIMPRFARERVWESQDRRLAVVPSLPEWPNE